jgi:hypothetical protein
MRRPEVELTPFARGHSVGCTETAAEVAGVDETAPAPYRGDAQGLAVVGQLAPCAFEPLVNDPLGQGQVVRCPDVVEMANRDVVGSGDSLSVQAGIR